MKQEMQHWLSRNRPPRVQITYDVETLGATVKQEIPFIVGIIGDFAGGSPQKPLVERSFVEIDRDNFANVMKSLQPSVKLATSQQPFVVVRTPEATTVEQDTSAPGITPTLSFDSMDDFAPPAVIKQLFGLAQLMETRQNLSDLMARLGTDPTLEGSLAKAAAPLALARAKSALPDAGKKQGAATDTTPALFAAAVAAVVKVETAEPNKSTVTSAGSAVAAAFAADGPYAKAYAAAQVEGAKATQLQAAGAAAWAAALVVRGGMTTLSSITASYDAADQTHADALKAVAAAQAGADAFVTAAGAAAVSGSSALALNP